MSIAGIAASSFFAAFSPATVQNKFQKAQQEFTQLGQDLQSGNLSQAQDDFSSLQKLFPSQWQSGSSSTQSGSQIGSQSANPISQEIAQLGQDLKAGNLSAAQSDFTTLQQDLQQQQGGNSVHRHHHHAGGSQGTSQPSQQNGIATLFGDLGQDLQSGNLTAAQQTYSTLQQDFLQFAGGATSSSGSSSGSTSDSSSLNVSA